MKIYLIISALFSLALLGVFLNAVSGEFTDTIKRVRGHRLRGYKGPYFKEDKFQVFIILVTMFLTVNSICSFLLLVYGIFVGKIIIF